LQARLEMRALTQTQRTADPCSTSQRTTRPSWPPVISTRPLRDQTTEVTGSLHTCSPKHAQKCLVQDGCQAESFQRCADMRTSRVVAGSDQLRDGATVNYCCCPIESFFPKWAAFLKKCRVMRTCVRSSRRRRRLWCGSPRARPRRCGSQLRHHQAAGQSTRARRFKNMRFKNCRVRQACGVGA